MRKCLLGVSVFLACYAAQAVTFFEIATAGTQKKREEIIASQFVQDMSKGVLSQARFSYFKTEDKKYVWRYSDNLMVLAAKAGDYRVRSFLQQAAVDSTKEWNGPRPTDMSQCPSCLAYSNFEAASVAHSFAVGIAALLPCYTVYWEVGNWLKGHSVPHNPYQFWIDAYSEPGSHKHVEDMVSFANEIYEISTSEVRESMLRAYIFSTIYELQFFDSAYNLIQWETTHAQ